MSNVMIVGVDGSKPGERAAAFAANVARAQGANLLIVYVIEWSPYTCLLYTSPSPRDS